MKDELLSTTCPAPAVEPPPPEKAEPAAAPAPADDKPPIASTRQPRRKLIFVPAAPPTGPPGRKLPALQVAQRYGIVVRTLDRWLADDTMNFPRPSLVINRRRYWDVSQLENWEAAA